MALGSSKLSSVLLGKFIGLSIAMGSTNMRSANHDSYRSELMTYKSYALNQDMMVEDLGVEAKESVVRKVAKLMCLLELLQSINSIKADYITHQQDVEPGILILFYVLLTMTNLYFGLERVGANLEDSEISGLMQVVKKPKNKLGGSKTTWKTETGSVRVERIGSSRRLTRVELSSHGQLGGFAQACARLRLHVPGLLTATARTDRDGSRRFPMVNDTRLTERGDG
uniref:Uncharacterized protein n=1 Tax=Cucumis melo TaxID=3656 RepID=A0A9I9E8I4_CUCME